jgi:hypothetical protein
MHRRCNRVEILPAVGNVEHFLDDTAFDQATESVSDGPLGQPGLLNDLFLGQLCVVFEYLQNELGARREVLDLAICFSHLGLAPLFTQFGVTPRPKWYALEHQGDYEASRASVWVRRCPTEWEVQFGGWVEHFDPAPIAASDSVPQQIRPSIRMAPGIRSPVGNQWSSGVETDGVIPRLCRLKPSCPTVQS